MSVFLLVRRSRVLAMGWTSAVLAAVLVGTASTHVANAQDTPAKPTLAVLDFTNSAIKNHADYAPLSKGLGEMLITEFSANRNIRVVERDRLQALLGEQDLSASGRIEQTTAVAKGKTLGAQHMLFGTFVIDTKNVMRMDIRVINTETSESEFTASVSGKADNMLDLLVQLAAKVNTGLRLPTPQADFSAGKSIGASGPNQFKSMMLLSRALEQQDRKNKPEAIALYKESLKENPNNERARTLLASLEGVQK